MEDDRATMEQLRADLIRRARIERHGEIDIEQMSSYPPTSRRHLPRLFRRGHPPPSAREMYSIDIESPKSPEVNDGSAQSRPFQFSNFVRPWTARSQDPRAQGEALPEMRQFSRPLTAPAAATAPPRAHHRLLRGGFTNTNGDESQLSEDSIMSQHRRRLSGDGRLDRRHRCAQRPKRFMMCFPWVKSSRVRKQIVACCISGFILILLIAVYLGLTMTKKVRTSEMTIMLVLVILFATLFFFHGLIRLCITLVRGSRQSANRTRLPNYGSRGYAVPPQPIPVVLARDEEAAGVESATVKSNPPAYGLWRESVRVDPNRLFWQRNESVSEVQPRRLSHVGPRPPSYASDDGVSYVMEAAPRSTAPRTDVPLPTHPSEVGRVAQPPRETWH